MAATPLDLPVLESTSSLLRGQKAEQGAIDKMPQGGASAQGFFRFRGARIPDSGVDAAPTCTSACPLG